MSAAIATPPLNFTAKTEEVVTMGVVVSLGENAVPPQAATASAPVRSNSSISEGEQGQRGGCSRQGKRSRFHDACLNHKIAS